MRLGFILFVTLFLCSCGQVKDVDGEGSQFSNKEDANERDVSKSEKTSEKISESVGEKTGEIPKSLLSGFRKSGISEKIKVTESLSLPTQQFKIKLPPKEQEEINEKLVKAVRRGGFFAVRFLLENGANAQVGYRFWVNDSKLATFPILVLLHFFGAKTPDIPIIKSRLLSPEKVAYFDPLGDHNQFWAHAKNLDEKVLLLELFSKITALYIGQNPEDYKLLEAIELEDVKMAEEAINNGANPNVGIRHPFLLNESFHILPLLLARGGSVLEKINNSTYAENIFKERNKQKVKLVLELGFGHSLQATAADFDSNFDSYDSLYWTLRRKDYKTMEKFLQQGANPNVGVFSKKDPNSYLDQHRYYQLDNLLVIAARRGSILGLILLLKYGADPHFKFPGEKSAIDVVSSENYLAKALLLKLITPDEALNLQCTLVQEKIINRQRTQQNLNIVVDALHENLLDKQKQDTQHKP